MASTAHFNYLGNVVVDPLRLLTSEPERPPGDPRPIVVKKVVHLIPIQVHILQGDQPMVIAAYMDYATNTVELPPTALVGIDDPDAFRAALTGHVQNVILPQTPEQNNLEPEEVVGVQSLLRDGAAERHTEFARKQQYSPEEYLREDEDDDDD